MFKSLEVLSENLPATGDNMPITTLLIIGGVALAAIIVTTILAKKNKK